LHGTNGPAIHEGDSPGMRYLVACTGLLTVVALLVHP
jgi:hypothetical protein